MISQSWKRSVVVLGAVAATAFAYADTMTPSPTAATTPVATSASTAKWYDTVGFSGYLQSSYTGNLSAPRSRTNIGRYYDAAANSFTFNTFLLQIAKPVGDSDHYGFTVRLRTGKDAQTLKSSDVNASPATNEFFVQEAYLTYAVPAMTKLSFIAGKFVTSEGFEAIDSVNNPNFSEGLLFTYAEPFTHTGVKANYVISDKVNTTIGLVNGWDNPTDQNDGKTFLWQVATTPIKPLTWSFQGTYGKETNQHNGLPASDHSKRLSLDTVLGFNVTDKLSLNGQANWAQETYSSNTPDGTGTSHWFGAGLWASLVTSAVTTESARFEVLRDQNNGARFYSGTNPVPLPFENNKSANQTVKEFTLTHKHMLTSALGMRFEYRHDWSNEPFFERKDGTAVRNQNTLASDIFLTF